MNTFHLNKAPFSLKKKKIWFFEMCLKKKKKLIFKKEKQTIPNITNLTSDNILISYFKYLATFQQFLQKDIIKTIQTQS